jgi:2-phosphosulfolactate phosphatase
MRRTDENEHAPLLQLDWGIDGVRFALKNHDIVVIVDTLRFSTAVATAVANGFTIYPVSDKTDGKALAKSLGAEMSGRPGEAKYTISPLSYKGALPNDNHRVVLYSPNGATCAALAGTDDTVYIGCFLNAQAVSDLVYKSAIKEQRGITMVAAGEQRAIDTGERIVYDREAAYPVFAIEDYLACGAIISHTRLRKSAEALLCEMTFAAARDRIEDLLLDSFSGRYLVENGLKDDVAHAVQHDLYDSVPVLDQGKITEYRCP